MRLAKEHDRAKEIENVQRYRMPEERKGKDQDFVYAEVDERERMPNSEQRKWEEEQMHFAQYKFGAKDAGKKKVKKEYEIILDSEIEFVQAMKSLPGTKMEEVRLEPWSNSSVLIFIYGVESMCSKTIKLNSFAIFVGSENY